MAPVTRNCVSLCAILMFVFLAANKKDIHAAGPRKGTSAIAGEIALPVYGTMYFTSQKQSFGSHVPKLSFMHVPVSIRIRSTNTGVLGQDFRYRNMHSMSYINDTMRVLQRYDVSHDVRIQATNTRNSLTIGMGVGLALHKISSDNRSPHIKGLNNAVLEYRTGLQIIARDTKHVSPLNGIECCANLNALDSLGFSLECALRFGKAGEKSRLIFNTGFEQSTYTYYYYCFLIPLFMK